MSDNVQKRQKSFLFTRHKTLRLAYNILVYGLSDFLKRQHKGDAKNLGPPQLLYVHGLSSFSSGSIWKTGKVLFNYIREQKLEDGRYRNCKKYFYSPTHHNVNFLHILKIVVGNI